MPRKTRRRKTRHPKWLPKIEEHDFAAAASYLALIYPHAQCKTLVAALGAPAIVRASQLSLLGISNSHVEKDRAQIDKGEALSPLLLVRDEKNRKVVVADGYHRLCAVYQVDEDAWIPCKIV